MISGEMTVARLLDAHPELVEVLASYHPHFERLRSRVLRRIMAPRVTIAQAARMASIPPDELVTALRTAVGEFPAQSAFTPDHTTPEIPEADAEEVSPQPLPANVSDAPRVHLDVRDEIRRGEEPLSRIMAAVKALPADHVLVVRTPFPPIPLYDLLGRRGFRHWTERHAADDWSATFARDTALPTNRAPHPASTGARHMVLDVRGLEPPEPMVRVLHAIEQLEVGDDLEVRHDRRPIFLYPQLDERGFTHQTDEPAPGLVRIVIRRRGA
jgi:uncharacterized protein (DUF2249 family)